MAQKLKTKTKTTLLAEGWKEGVFGEKRNKRTGIYFGEAEAPEASISEYAAAKLLGKEVFYKGRSAQNDNPSFKVQLGAIEGFLPWRAFATQPKESVETVPTVKRYFLEKVGEDDDYRDDHYFKVSSSGTVDFQCSMRTLTHAQARALAELVLKHVPKEKKQ